MNQPIEWYQKPRKRKDCIMLIHMEVYCFISFVVLGIGAQMLKYCPNINPIKSIRLEAYQISNNEETYPLFLLALTTMVAMA